MIDFYRQMRVKLRDIELMANKAKRYCGGADVEGCVVYEDLIDLQQEIAGAIAFYAEEVPAGNREDIRRMVVLR